MQDPTNQVVEADAWRLQCAAIKLANRWMSVVHLQVESPDPLGRLKQSFHPSILTDSSSLVQAMPQQSK